MPMRHIQGLVKLHNIFGGIDMSDIQKPSFSLLNQKEVDALVDFLNDKRNSINSDVMNQKSIDKLITLITGDSDHIILDLFDPFASVDPGLLAALDFRMDDNDVCELTCTLDDVTGYVTLTARNMVTEKTLKITPKLINENDTEEWGYSISPVFFNRIAKIFNLKYTTETHDTICNIFAKHTYDSESHKIAEIYLPTNSALLECML